MKRNIFTSVIIMLLCLMMVNPVSAQESSSNPRLVDEADLLAEAEEEDLLAELDEISERQQFDVVVVTVDSFEGKSAQDYAADFYDYNGYGFGSEKDGSLFLIGMEEREWFILTTGFGITAITDYDMEEMSEDFLPYLSDEDYASAFSVYAESCDELISAAKSEPEENTQGTYDYEDAESVYQEEMDEESSPGIISSIIIAAVLALFPVGIMRGQLKSVQSKKEAAGYVKEGSQKITVHKDIFLYHTINRVERPKDEPSHHSKGGSHTFKGSSGRSHGGRGGRF